MIVDSISEQSWQLQHNFKKKFWQPHNTDAEAYLPKHDCSGSLHGNINSTVGTITHQRPINWTIKTRKFCEMVCMSPINCPLNKDTTPAFVADLFVFTHVPLFVSSGHYDTFAGFFFSAACFSTVNRQLFSKHKLFQLSIG